MSHVTSLFEHPALASFAPMLYVAWADGELSNQEVDHIRQVLVRQEWPDSEARELLSSWLDPSKPPSATQLEELLSEIQRRASGSALDERRSLAELGAGLVVADPRPERDEISIEALREVELALGVESRTATLELLNQHRKRPPVPADPAAEAETGRVLARRLQEVLDGRYSEIRTRVRSILSRDEFRYRRGLPVDVYRDQVLGWCKALADEGLGSLAYPKEVGGQADMGAFMAVFETLATHDLSLLIKFGVQFGLWGGSVHALGTEEHHRRFLPATGSLDLPGCFAMSETGHGSNVRELETVARFDPEVGDFVLQTPTVEARKDYIGNAARHGVIATVFAQLEVPANRSADDGVEQDQDFVRHGVHAFVVPIRDPHGNPLPGVEIEDCGLKLGLNGVDNGRLYFRDVRVPRENLLDRYGSVSASGEYSSPIASESKRFFTMLGTLVGGRVSVAAGALSASKSGLTIAVRYGLDRRQFGPPGEPETVLLDYPSHQRRLMPLIARSYAIDSAIKWARDRYLERTEQDSVEVEHLAAGVKAFSTWHAIEALQECREACGGAGYLAANRFADLRSDSDVFATFEGDNTVLMQLVAKGLLTDFRQQFGEMRLSGILRFVARRAGKSLKKKNPISAGRKGSSHLRSKAFQSSCFEAREKDLLLSLSRRLKKKLSRGVDSQRAFLDCQTHALALAEAHVDRVVYESFNRTVAASAAPVRGTLRRLRNLFALETLERRSAWFLTEGFFSPGKASAIRDEVDCLCAELRPDARALVDGFGIPDQLLDAELLR